MGIKIVSSAIAKAKNVIKNSDFEKTLDTSDEWITTRTGIKERRFISEDQSNEQLASESARGALENSGIDKRDIKVCIVATFTPDRTMPSVSCGVAKNLGLSEDTICFDLNAACTGFVTALNTAYRLLEDMQDKFALVIGSEVISKTLDMTDRSTAILFGDGAGAAIVKRDKDLKYAFISGVVADENNVLCTDKMLNYISMDGKAVFRFATEKMTYAISEILKRNKLAIEDIDMIIPHQANKRIIDYAQKKLAICADKFYINLDRYGNTSAASIPIALFEAGIAKGKKIICVGFGAGLTYGAVLIHT